MKKFFGYFKQFWKEEFHLPSYLIVLAFLAVYLYFNYQYHDRWERIMVIKYYYTGWLVPFLFGYYTFNYLTPLLLISLVSKDWAFWKKPMFWVMALLATFLIAFDTGFTFYQPWLNANAPIELRYWLRKIILNLASIITHLLPLFIFYKLFDRKTDNFYGLTSKNVDWKLYWLMLGFMAVLVTLASFHPSFYKFYPLYKPKGEAAFLDVPIWITGLGYELAYGFDFITVEHMFRGFLVIGMAQAIGPKAVLPMAALYCTYHFGKPAGEAISSIFGGYILGVVALYSKNVWGGVFVHMGIAWLMELAAALQNYFRQ